MPEENDRLVELDELLAAEFEYIAQTAAQANDDRARVSSFYLLAVGSFVAALLGTQVFNLTTSIPYFKIVLTGIFVLLTLLGVSTIMQLAQLRAAWHNSMLAMNQIKDFAMQQSPELTQAFRWTSKTLPPKYKTSSVSFFQAREVALIGGLMFGTAVYFLQEALHIDAGILEWIICIFLGGLAAYAQIMIYKRILT